MSVLLGLIGCVFISLTIGCICAMTFMTYEINESKETLKMGIPIVTIDFILLIAWMMYTLEG